MAINDVVADGLGFNAGQLGFLLTQGFGDFVDLGGVTLLGLGFGTTPWGMLRFRRPAAIL
ncbi:MAG: hypothetical protein A4C66_13985 [Nitrospira sp. HN-bin3]|uniref:hypothetical protein n=1 Tax=Nitrospira cf. moscoviensis SBR1015 TaxID=96242 RepID=UPI000A0B305C|nr:hypothetical protein [Nitrospira cf. moscoviensis SBR1015]OQW51347.1 MAG: hypothetical protein A4C66_13985 [Nitrospira sp. HN-bin3]